MRGGRAVQMTRTRATSTGEWSTQILPKKIPVSRGVKSSWMRPKTFGGVNRSLVFAWIGLSRENRESALD
jgi:hypothetical protein